MTRLLTSVSAVLVALAGCAPVPISSKVYAPNPADAVPVQGGGSGCMMNNAKSVANRQIGTADVRVSLWASPPEQAKPHATVDLQILQRKKLGPIQSVRINPGRIRLEEGGKSYAPATRKTHNNTNADYGLQFNGAYVTFPSPTGNAEAARVVFQPGAITIGGRAVDFAPIRFTRTTEVAIYLFPCIPA